MRKRKDPKKVRAGRLGGQKSGGNFRFDKERASRAGKRSAWKRSTGKLSDFPLEYEDMEILELDGKRRSSGRRYK